MWRLGPAWQDEAALARAWREAAPFPHLVIDDFADEAQLPALLELLEEEPVERRQSDLFAFDATAPEPTSAEVRALRDELAAVLGPPLSRLSGVPLGRVELRAYAYRPGDHLLPHTDHQQRLGRVIAYAYYLPSPEPPEGGELELFTCRLERDGDEALEGIASSKLIEPKANRLVLFEVGDRSLHQVREVLSGMRISLAGWFYP